MNETLVTKQDLDRSTALFRQDLDSAVNLLREDNKLLREDNKVLHDRMNILTVIIVVGFIFGIGSAVLTNFLS